MSKIQNLPPTTTLEPTDVFYVVTSPDTTPADKKITVADLKNELGGGGSYVASAVDITLTVANNIVNMTAADTTATLPLSTDIEGTSFVFKNSSDGDILVETTDDELVDGESGPVSIPSGDSYTFVSTGSGYIII